MFNHDQTVFIVTSNRDILYVDIKKEIEIDLDDKEGISSIQNIIQDDQYFYVLANKRDMRLGFYLFKIFINDPYPRPEDRAEYLINWPNKLEIGNCDLFMMYEQEEVDGKEVDVQSIIISYKSIGINTYNVFVIDINSSLMKYWNESL